MTPYVLIITIHADPAMPPGYGEWGGTHTYMHELLDSLDDNGTDCILVTRRALEELPAVERYRSHCTIYRLQNGPAVPINKTLLRCYHTDNFEAICRIIETQPAPPAVIHSVYWNSGRLGVEISQKYHIPLVHSVISNSHGRVARGANEPVGDRATFEHAIYNFAKWILCVSEDEKNDLIKFYDVAPEKLIVAGQYIHPSFILPAHDANGFPRLNSNISPETQTAAAMRYAHSEPVNAEGDFWAQKAFTYFGRIDESKGVDHILVAWHHVYRRNRECPPLWLIGGSVSEISSMRATVSHRIPELSALEREGKIVWWGCLDPIGASTLLLKTLVLVTNSLYEPGGRVVVEAMCEGLPVIATPNGFAYDLISDWGNGFLVDHGDEARLSRRMEHYIRQPYLSNAMGLNAKQTAASVVRRWNFTKKHLWAYGLASFEVPAAERDSINYFHRGEIHLFPYENVPFSEQLLVQFFEEQTGEQIVSGPTQLDGIGATDMFQIRSDKGTYLIRHPLSQLSTGPLCNPICRMRYVRSAQSRYRVEKASYQASQSGILVGCDDFHQLLLLRENNFRSLKPEDVLSCIDFFVERRTTLPEETAAQFDGALRLDKWNTIEKIEELIDSLSANFPDYYFDPSGIFSPYIGWKIAPHLLSYNLSGIKSDDMERLQHIYGKFASASQLPPMAQLRETDAELVLQQICREQGRWQITTRENRSIGIMEYEIAEFLFALFQQLKDQKIETWYESIKNMLPSDCDMAQLVSSLAYRMFYDAVLHSVMEDSTVEPLLNAMEFLSGIVG